MCTSRTLEIFCRFILTTDVRSALNFMESCQRFVKRCSALMARTRRKKASSVVLTLTHNHCCVCRASSLVAYVTQIARYDCQVILQKQASKSEKQAQNRQSEKSPNAFCRKVEQNKKKSSKSKTKASRQIRKIQTE